MTQVMMHNVFWIAIGAYLVSMAVVLTGIAIKNEKVKKTGFIMIIVSSVLLFLVGFTAVFNVFNLFL